MICVAISSLLAVLSLPPVLYNWSNLSEGRGGREEGGSDGGRDRNAAQVFLSVYIIFMPVR